MASWSIADFNEVFKLISALSGLKNRRFYINGIEETWESSFGFLWCYNNRNQAYQPDLYCFGKDNNRINPWGCIQIQMDWVESADWFSYGKFIENGKNSFIWKIDKQRILHEVNQNLHRVRMCPSIRFNFIQSLLDHLPETIDLKINKNWEYKVSYNESPGAIRIIEKNKCKIFGFENDDEYYSDGVKPKGFNYLKQLVKSCAKESKEIIPAIEQFME